MELDYNWLTGVLSASGYVVHRVPHSGECVIDAHVGGFDVQVRIVLADDFPWALPKFHLLERCKYGSLAHVSWGGAGSAEICFGAPSAFHLDYENPDRVVLASLDKALGVLSKALSDQDYNESELKREFVPIWRLSIKPGAPHIMCLDEPLTEAFEELSIRSDDTKRQFGVGGMYIATGSGHALNEQHYFVRSAASLSRSNQGKGILLNIPELLIPPSPGDTVSDWWHQLLSAQPSDLQDELREYARHCRAKEYFIICRAKVETGAVWFALHCQRDAKGRVPLATSDFEGWEFAAASLNVISRENLLPRGGSDVRLGSAKVCVIGCGSVGGYVADLLASSGVGELHLFDPDLFLIENLHRHSLSPEHLFRNKAQALSDTLEGKYPFVRCQHFDGGLSSIISELRPRQYDLIVSVTGDQTQERYLNQYIMEQGIDIPVVYAWVEAYGVGGHAVACMPATSGCLNCLFHDLDSGEESLYPSTGFIQSNQEVISSHSGCGQEYLSYSNIDAVETASVAARLATRVLSGGLSQSVVASWRGDDSLAQEHQVKLTHRYFRLSRTLDEIPVHNDNCRVCHHGS